MLVRLALCARPPPPLLFAYIEAMCVYRTPSISVEDYDEQCIVVSLLSQLLVIKPADYGAVDTIARLILDAGGNAHVLEHLPIKNLIEAFKESTCNFWRAALRLVRDPKASGAQLFTRLVHGAMRDGWPLVHDEDALEVLLHDIQEVTARMDATHSHSQGPQSDAVRHALAALQHGVTASADDLFDEEMPTTTKTTLWSSTPFSPYMTALLQAWRESEGPGRRRVLPPQPPHPEPDLVLLVYTLSRLDMNWHSKCYTALGMLRTRCAPGSPASVERDATSVFLFELIVATNLCALQELRVDPCARTAQTWRHIFGGVVRHPRTDHSCPLSPRFCSSIGQAPALLWWYLTCLQLFARYTSHSRHGPRLMSLLPTRFRSPRWRMPCVRAGARGRCAKRPVRTARTWIPTT